VSFTLKKKKGSLVPAVYIHIPFCRQICPFCNFAVRRDALNLHEKYVLGIINEIEIRTKFLKDFYREDLNRKINKANFLESIYIGGGTPSRLKTLEVSRLIEKVKDYFPFSRKIEISFEMNPEDVNSNYLTELYEIGINRISLGGQSFQSKTLKILGRSHSNQKLRDSIKIIKNSPIKNWNLDLIFGVPEQSVISFEKDVEEAVLYEPSHISLYGLEINEKTPFGKNLKFKEWYFRHHNRYCEMYSWGIKYLEKSKIFQYEVSNFSKKGKEGRNNLLVWSGNEYLGFGVGAHSFFGGIRWSNKRSIKTYVKDLYQKKWPVDFEEKLSNRMIATEILYLNLRNSKGLNIEHWQNCFGFELQKTQIDFICRLCELGYAFWQEQNLCLSSKGFLIVDSITVELMP